MTTIPVSQRWVLRSLEWKKLLTVSVIKSHKDIAIICCWNRTLFFISRTQLLYTCVHKHTNQTETHIFYMRQMSRIFTMLTLCKALLDIYYAITSPLLKHGWKVVPNVPHGNETQTAGSPDVTADLLWDSQHINSSSLLLSPKRRWAINIGTLYCCIVSYKILLLNVAILPLAALYILECVDALWLFLTELHSLFFPCIFIVNCSWKNIFESIFNPFWFHSMSPLLKSLALALALSLNFSIEFSRLQAAIYDNCWAHNTLAGSSSFCLEALRNHTKTYDVKLTFPAKSILTAQIIHFYHKLPIVSWVRIGCTLIYKIYSK